MVNGARRGRNGAAVPVLPDEIVLWEILVRVPAKELLRCRAVCRSWRRVTSDNAYLLAHQGRQPSLPLVAFEAENIVHETVDALDLVRSSSVRRPILGFNDRSPCGYMVHASCDGFLLLSFSSHRGGLHLCNPATRQWLTLRDLSCDGNFAALYPHRPSGEYRVLHWKKINGSVVYYVLTVGSGQEHRCIGLPVASPSMKDDDTSLWLIHACGYPSVLLQDCLYWYNYNHRGGDGKIVICDTVGESFRWMQPPTAISSARGPDVLKMDDGTLCVGHVDLDAMTAEAWVLHDHEKEIWSPKFLIRLPVEEMGKDPTCVDFLYDGAVVSEDGDMLLIGGNRPSSLFLFHCDSKGKLVKKFLGCEKVEPSLLALRFKESLVRHGFFKREDGKRFRMPRSLRGLY